MKRKRAALLIIIISYDCSSGWTCTFSPWVDVWLRRQPSCNRFKSSSRCFIHYLIKTRNLWKSIDLLVTFNGKQFISASWTKKQQQLQSDSATVNENAIFCLIRKQLLILLVHRALLRPKKSTRCALQSELTLYWLFTTNNWNHRHLSHYSCSPKHCCMSIWLWFRCPGSSASIVLLRCRMDLGSRLSSEFSQICHFWVQECWTTSPEEDPGGRQKYQMS